MVLLIMRLIGMEATPETSAAMAICSRTSAFSGASRSTPVMPAPVSTITTIIQIQIPGLVIMVASRL